MRWHRVSLETDSGYVDAIAPAIISASRSTDIPAFHSQWFINRLTTGYVRWVNPFNQKASFISFNETGAIVFWTKNPTPIIPLLPMIDEQNIDYYFQFTLNDYETEKFEPNIPSLQSRIATFKTLSQRLGSDKVIWRFDPILIGEGISPNIILQRISRIGDCLHGFTNKLVISFVDINAYQRVQNNIKRSDISLREPLQHEILQIAEKLQTLSTKWGIHVTTCCETVDLEKFDIKRNKCIDDKLLHRICSPQNLKLKKFINQFSQRNTLFNICKEPIPKDPGQRQECGCVISKDIGMYNTCGHLCVYCYANTSKELVLKNLKRKNDSFDMIIK